MSTKTTFKITKQNAASFLATATLAEIQAACPNARVCIPEEFPDYSLEDLYATAREEEPGSPFLADIFNFVDDIRAQLKKSRVPTKEYAALTAFQTQIAEDMHLTATKWAVSDFDVDKTISELLDIIAFTDFANVDGYNDSIYQCLKHIAKTAPDLTYRVAVSETSVFAKALVPTSEIIIEGLANRFHHSSTIFFLKEHVARFANQATNTNPALRHNLATKLLAAFQDTQFNCLIYRSIGNAALFQAINALTVSIINKSATDELFTNNIISYIVASEYCEKHGETTYDKCMTLRDALTLLMTPRPPNEAMIESLSTASKISVTTLMNIAELSAVERTTKFRKYKTDIVTGFDTAIISATKAGGKLVGTHASQEHYMIIRMLRAATKAKISTLNYTVKTSRLDRLGFFSFIDKFVVGLEAVGNEMEFEHPELMDEASFLGLTQDCIVEYKRLGG